ncbi:MAG: Chemotaxis protein CheW [Syntrophorhabdus sp. PtaB.Bin047]|jgi:purine-binding chemotaxis protein CheW|nr:MAG: Chemotaxis protein CheW [Syntrophorhabdus sp. PtaB.Bin047]
MSVSAITETRQYLTFHLGGEIFGMDVCHIREILEFTSVARVPGTPDFMKGVINLRGSVVPVLDMRLKFGLKETEKTVDTCIIVIEVSFEEEKTVIGALVDSVEEVFELDPDLIEPAPRVGSHLKTEFIRGMGKRDDSFIIILDAEKMLSSEELSVATVPMAETSSEARAANE